MPGEKTSNVVGSLSLPSEVVLPRKIPKVPGEWNTNSLGSRLGADAASAASASILVAPVICVIDRSIVEKAAKGTSFIQCLKRSITPAILRPHAFLASKPFALIFTLYFSTYLAANGMDTVSSTMKNKSATAVSSGGSKFVATSAVNMSLCVYKDSQFARMFGKPSSSPASTIPRLSYALFAARDSMTIFASFNLPSVIAPKLAELPRMVRQRFSRILSSESGRLNTAQFVAPAAMQVLSTPIHLLGLDLYNRQGQLGLGERFARVARDWGVSTLARMGRIVPAFGVGGVVNAKVRRGLMEKIDG
ncbi:uncharacterized protein HMPREF1541_01426 [Cyphellophora europaea CBS 101466]|uniref:Sequence orphan n=1 Tax=Cyphellophora europaea (strain CBS 101466) TaxID=1220924 RepID=W2SH93_CYPE1|nr:uncharacterized protein HMPREF1541_01426 [Cyphellophora europaea CBS 101466]ETN47234.1 hypothetical protein HMPREF1541_01426 [Cyphellophora europaea CBS 101466]